MKYIGKFYSIIRNNEYTVEIVTNNSTSTEVEITMGPEPFTTSMDSGEDIMYVPVKYQSATLQIVGNQYLFDLYSSAAKDNTIKLIDASTDTVLFTGYTSPNIYTAPYDFVTETYNVEALDGLSILQYYDYEPIGSGKDFATFADIINHILSTAGCYTKWYFTNNIHIPNSSDNVNKLTISEQNFFDEDDEPMKMNEVLEHICRFMNVTAIGQGDKVYFVNYDAIKEGENSYKEYTVGSSSFSNTTLDSSMDIDSSSYSASGADISLAMTYSRVTIKDSLYAVESIIPSLYEDEDLENTYYDSSLSQNWAQEYRIKCRHFKGNIAGNNNNNDFFDIRERYYTNKKYEHYFYTNNDGVETTKCKNMYEATSKIGAIFTKYRVGVGNTQDEAYAKLEGGNFDDYLLLPINHKNYLNKKRIESKSEFAKPFFVSGDAKFIAKGSLLLTDRTDFQAIRGRDDTTTEIGHFPDSGTLEGDFDGWKFLGIRIGSSMYIYKSDLKLRIDIQVTGNGTYTNDVPFYAYEDDPSEELREKKNQHDIFYKDFGIQNTPKADLNIDEDGYILNTNLPSGEVVAAKPILTIYAFDALSSRLAGYTYSPLAGIYIKDFDIVAKVPAQYGNLGYEDINNLDTEYTIEINDAYVSECPTIEFKICTYDYKQLNYSAVAYKPGSGNYVYLDELEDDALNQTARAEELLGYRIVNQYSDPAKIVNLNLFPDYKVYSLVHEGFLDVDMIVASMDIDYVNDKATVKLIEKK